ncbi:NADPH-dependent FMN reductase family protein [Streptomyces lavendulae]|uniref:hypothetical protein n=1 Tax=Streptomyces lavendulae TaxID=1914 RepID=UPI0036E95968
MSAATGRSAGTRRHALVVPAHHRADSLTAGLARRARERPAAQGCPVDLLDLHAVHFVHGLPQDRGGGLSVVDRAPARRHGPAAGGPAAVPGG